jgi:CheY-like chemotaxis protein
VGEDDRQTTSGARVELLKARNVLVVEDEFLIAMDLADMLRKLGAASVRTEFSVADALASLEGQPPPDCAALDFRLGAATAAPVADALLMRRIPFIFVTGYEDVALMPRRFHALPVAHKPMNMADIARAFARALAAGAIEG